MSLDLDLLKTITSEVRGAKKDEERQVLDGIQDAYAGIIIAKSVPGWDQSETAMEAIAAGKATIEAATDGMNASVKERIVNTGKAMARVSVAKKLLKAVNASDAMSKRRDYENLFVRLLYDGLEGRNFTVLPYTNDKGEMVTPESLQGSSVTVDGKTFSRGAEIIFGRGDFVQRDEATDKLSVTVFHAPGFQGSKLVQALTICLQKSGKRLSELHREFKKSREESRKGFQSRGGEFANTPMADGLKGITGKEQ